MAPADEVSDRADSADLTSLEDVADYYRIALKGNVHRGMNRALSVENLYGTADHLWFVNEESARRVAEALIASGHPCGINKYTPRERHHDGG